MVVMRRRFFCSILKIPTNHKSIANKINATITIGQKVQAQVSSCVADVGYLVSLMLNDPELNSINGIIPINEEKYIQQLYRRPLRSGEQIQCFVGKIKGSTVLLSTRPLLKERLPIIKKSILQLLSYMPDSQIQIGIKSSSDEITRRFPEFSCSDVKRGLRSLVYDNLIKVSSYDTRLITENDPSPIIATLHVKNIRCYETKHFFELKSFLSEILFRSPLILTPENQLELTSKQPDESVSPPPQFFLKVKDIRLKPRSKNNPPHDGQRTNSSYNLGRTGFIDIAWNCQDSPHLTKFQDYQISEFKRQIEMLSIQLLNQREFRGGKIKIEINRNGNHKTANNS